MPVTKTPRPVILCILDGWGYLPNGNSNSIRLANTPNWTRLIKTYPTSTLEASETNVGLPDGQMGNSEVGHMNLGAGRVVLQGLPRINHAIEVGDLPKNAPLQDLIAALKQSGGTAHVMGLLSPGGVHSHQRHMAAVAKIIAEAGVKVAVHAFLDGRDTPPRSALGFLEAFDQDIESTDGIAMATVSGRFYPMDRDNRWDRVEAAYRAMVSGEGVAVGSASDAVDHSYKDDATDEFVKPSVIGSYGGMADGDGVVMINFRADRAREILMALLEPGFDHFARGKIVKFASALGMVEYSSELAPLMGSIFGPDLPTETLGEILSKAGLKQLRIAETEKYPHVTYFFNGGNETAFPGEERILVPSPKVATYDLKPEMSAFEITDKLLGVIDRFDLIVVNYANADMVGHSGMIKPTVKAIETIDTCLGRLSAAVEECGGVMLITADHGNAEQMTDPVTGEPHTAHTTNPVPVVLVNPPSWVEGVSHGKLADVAPTLLTLLHIDPPAVMTGRSLLVAKQARADA